MGAVGPPVRLDLATWREVEAYLTRSSGIILPVGSTEQHGPMGLIGTDALCATVIAERAAGDCGALVAPTLAYTPAEFNTGFPGTVSVSVETFARLFGEVVSGLAAQGFGHIYVLNGHGANLAPMQAVAGEFTGGLLRIQSWWAFADVNTLRKRLYEDWEGLHATPSEIAITQARWRILPPGEAADPPRKLEAQELMDRAGDRHGSAERHRAEFPDGRVGSHSALARPEDGETLIRTAAAALAQDYADFVGAPRPGDHPGGLS